MTLTPTPSTLMVWEYKIVQVGKGKTKDLEKQLNELGRDGWELVSVAAPQTGQMGALSTGMLVATLKRGWHRPSTT